MPTLTSVIFTCKIERALREIKLIGLAILATLLVSAFFAPLSTNLLLYGCRAEGVALSNASQSGWPLPFNSSYTEETDVKSFPHMGQFDFPALVIDVAFFYVAIRILGALLAHALEQYDSDGHVKRLMLYLKRAALAVVGIAVIYYVFMLLTEQRPALNVGTNAVVPSKISE